MLIITLVWLVARITRMIEHSVTINGKQLRHFYRVIYTQYCFIEQKTLDINKTKKVSVLET